MISVKPRLSGIIIIMIRKGMRRWIEKLNQELSGGGDIACRRLCIEERPFSPTNLLMALIRSARLRGSKESGQLVEQR